MTKRQLLDQLGRLSPDTQVSYLALHLHRWRELLWQPGSNIAKLQQRIEWGEELIELLPIKSRAEAAWRLGGAR